MAQDEKLLQAVQKLYSFRGSVQFVREVEQGYLSHNVIVRDSEKKYFLKRYRFDMSDRVIEIQNAKIFFHDRGIPVILPIESKEKSSFFVYEDSFYSLFPFIEGYQFVEEVLRDNALRSSGEMLAKIHLVGKDGGGTIVKPRSFAWNREQFFDRVVVLRDVIVRKLKKDRYDKIALECLDLKESLVGRYAKKYDDFRLLQHDRHILHGDYHDENLFFDKNGNVTHVFDWEKVNCGPRGLDIARSLLLMCFWDGFSDAHFRNAEIYLKAYASLYPLKREYLREAVEAWDIEQMYSLWVLESYYLSSYKKTHLLFEPHIKRLQYFSECHFEYVDRIANMVGKRARMFG